MPSVYSFDIFDTCITRLYSQPSDLILDLARRILASHPNVGDKDIRNLATARLIAEKSARDKSNREDILLEDIYQELPGVMGLDVDTERMHNLELQLELASVVPVTETLLLCRDLITKGERVIFISDMYLPLETVKTLLDRSGYETEATQIYLSSETGLRKKTGNLYEHVLREENITPEELFHLGDHPVNDIRMARRRGINATQTSVAASNNVYSDYLLKRSGLWRRSLYKGRQSSRFIRMLFTDPSAKLPIDRQLALSRINALSQHLLRDDIATNKGDPDLLAIGHCVAAPLFSAFVVWLLEEATARGIRSLYFVARNGQIFHDLAQKISAVKGYQIECNYLYGSRAAWYPSSFAKFDDNFVQLLQRKYPDLSIEEILRDLSFSSEDCNQLISALSSEFHGDTSSGEPGQVRTMLEYLKDSEHAGIVERHFETCWRSIVDYLRQEGLFDQEQVGIVDIGWHLSSHNALHRITSRVNGSGFSGFYFGVGRNREDVDSQAPFYAFINNTASRRTNWLFKLGAMSLLEEVFAAADHPTTSGYRRTENGVIPTLKGDASVHKPESATIIQECMQVFAASAARKELLSDLLIAREDLLEQFERMYKFPNSAEARAIADTPVYALTSHSSAQQRTLAHTISMGELIHIVHRTLLAGRDISPKWVWLQGSMSMSGGFVPPIGKLLSSLESALLKYKP